jgi:hypothetical protein
MSTSGKTILFVLGVAFIALAGYVLMVGLYPRDFTIQWDEEVQLNDGRVIVVHVKRAYQRKGLRLERFPKYPHRMGMEFSFDAGLPTGRFTHYFKNGVLNFLDQKDGKWYVGYYADAGDDSSELGSREIYPHVAILNPDGSITKPKSWAEVPSEITQVNIMPATPDEQAISKFNGTRLTLRAKMQHWAAYPTGAGEHSIHRITPQSTIQGAKK